MYGRSCTKKATLKKNIYVYCISSKVKKIVISKVYKVKLDECTVERESRHKKNSSKTQLFVHSASTLLIHELEDLHKQKEYLE